MKKYLFCFWLILFNIAFCWAGQPLKAPLQFVPSDSVFAWGDDRSDLRATALHFAPNLVTYGIQTLPSEQSTLEENIQEWQQQVVPNIDIAGGMLDKEGLFDLLATKSMIQRAGGLFLQTADAHYLDVVERCALNALQAVLTPGDLNFDKHVAARALYRASGMYYAVDDEGIYVNMYVNSSAKVKTQRWDFMIDQMTMMPHLSRVKLRISGMDHGQQRIKMRLRMPDWACRRVCAGASFSLEGTPEELPTIYVNGREEHYPFINGYFVITRKWNNGDEVFFDFPMHVQRLYPAGYEKDKSPVVSLQRGPLVFGFREPTRNWYPVDMETIRLSEQSNQQGHCWLEVPAQNKAGERILQRAEPMMDGINYLWMNRPK